MQSRSHRKFCTEDWPDCNSVEVHCRDLVEDYKQAKELIKEFPDKIKWVETGTNVISSSKFSFRVLRYEDMCKNITNSSQVILDFLGYQGSHPDVLKWEKKHNFQCFQLLDPQLCAQGSSTPIRVLTKGRPGRPCGTPRVPLTTGRRSSPGRD